MLITPPFFARYADAFSHIATRYAAAMLRHVSRRAILLRHATLSLMSFRRHTPCICNRREVPLLSCFHTLLMLLLRHDTAGHRHICACCHDFDAYLPLPFAAVVYCCYDMLF